MRTAHEAFAASAAHPTIPYEFVSGVDGQTRTVASLMCMRDVLADYDLVPTDVSLGANYDSANDGWALTRSKNINDRAPKEGQSLYFPNPVPGSSGHIALATGVGQGVYSTPVYGPNLPIKQPFYDKFVTTIDDLARLCGNAYAGSANDFNGVAIDFTQPTDEIPGDTMTDLMYYATSGATSPDKKITVKTGDFYYQQFPGCPLFFIGATVDAKYPVEYTAFLQRTQNSALSRQALPGADIVKLIQQRGLTASPIFGGGGAIDTAVLIKAADANTAELVAAIVAPRVTQPAK